MMAGLRTRAASSVGSFVLASTLLAACGPGLPASVNEGSTVTVGWSGDLTSLNASTVDGATDDNREIAAATHDGFARLVDGDVVTDTSFGRVEVVDAAPESFTVRYDLADRSWSDGTPIDAADLMLAWAAQSGATGVDFDSVPSELRASSGTPDIDDFARSIDVPFETPVRDWHTALDVAVPAHVVGQLALGIDDPMEAKQAVIDAITGSSDDAAADLTKIADAWNTGFEVGDEEAPSDPVTVASGPYRVDGVGPVDGGGDRVRLVVNREYTGDVPPSYEQVDVVAGTSAESAFPGQLDVVQVRPDDDNFAFVRDLERRDQHAETTNDGLVWVLALRSDGGLFRDRAVRRAFLGAVTRQDLVEGGAKQWEDAYGATDSYLFAPGSDGYTVSQEDAGLREAFQAGADDPGAARNQAGVDRGTEVCVLYDTDSAFAFGAFEALQTSVREAGWEATSCGSPGAETTLEGGEGYQAVLTAVPLPQTPTDITYTWGGRERSNLTGAKDYKRSALVDELVRTPDPYDARDLQVQIEAGIVDDAIAVPLTMDPVVTLSERGMRAVMPESGGAVTLLDGVAQWEPER